MEKKVSFELAQELREKRFPQIETSHHSYFIGDEKQRYLKVGSIISKMKKEDDEHLIAAPTIEQVMGWLRTEHYIHILVDFFRSNGGTKLHWVYTIRYIKDDHSEETLTIGWYETYDEACIAGIKYVLEKI